MLGGDEGPKWVWCEEGTSLPTTHPLWRFAPPREHVWGRGVPFPTENTPHRGRSLGEGKFCFVISKWRILVNYEVLSVVFFFTVSSLSGVRVDSVAKFVFLSKQ